MPSGSQSTSTQSTAVQAPQATNPALSSLFTSLFGGGTGLGKTSADTAAGVQNGSLLTNNISQIYGSLQQNSQGAYQQGIGSIKAAAGAAGNALGTSTS